MDQIKTKALPIKEVLYPRYELLFMFDIAISHAIYAKYALQVAYINKRSDGQQPFLHTSCYRKVDGKIIIAEIRLSSKNLGHSQSTKIQKKIQTILDKYRLWPIKRGLISYKQPKYTNCQSFSTCIICIKGQK